MTAAACFRIAMLSIPLVAASMTVSVPMVPAGPAPDDSTSPPADPPKQIDDKSNLHPSSEALIFKEGIAYAGTTH